MEGLMSEAIVISDLHLGSDVCQARDLLDFLNQVPRITNKIILNGDIFDDLGVRKLNKFHWQIFDKIKLLRKHIDVVWIVGNHDGSINKLAELAEQDVKEEYILTSGDEKILIFHGHQYDNFIDNHPTITWFADKIYHVLQKIDGSHNLAKWAKHCSKQYLRCKEIIQKNAIERSCGLGCDKVICGHTHSAYASDIYYNSGCWTEAGPTYLTIDDGNISLNHIGVCCLV